MQRLLRLQHKRLAGLGKQRAGLALALSSLMRQQPRPALPPQTGGEMFLISGSVNRITLQQIAYLKKRKYPVWYLDKQTQLDPAYPDSEAGAQFLSPADARAPCGRALNVRHSGRGQQ